MPDYLPLFVDFSRKRVVIFGGGPVGERKAAYFAGADVTVISREFTPGLEAMPAVKLVRRHVSESDAGELIRGAFLVVVATGDRTLDRSLARLAEGSGALVNCAEGDGDVILPSKAARGDITVAVSTGGRSPAMSRFIRERLEETLTDEHADMVRLQAELREALKKRLPSQHEREKLLWEVLEDPGTWAALGRSYDEALALSLGKVRDGKHPNNEK